MSSEPRQIRWVPLVILLVLLSGLSTLLYFQREDIAIKQHEKELNYVKRRMGDIGKIQGDLAADLRGLSPEQMLDIQKRNANNSEEELARRLTPYFKEAQSAHPQFVAKFGTTGRTTVSLIPRPTSVTYRDYDDQYRQYCERDVDLYLMHTNDAGEIKKQGEEFLRQSIASAFQVKGSLPEDEIARLAEEILNGESTDPFLRGRAVGKVSPGNDSEAHKSRVKSTIRQSLDKLAGTTYPALAEVLLRYTLLHSDGSYLGDTSAGSELFHMAVIQWIRDESAEVEWHRCAHRRVNEMVSDKAKRNLLWLMTAEADYPRYWVHILAGEHYLNYATIARGSKYARDVTTDQWKSFHSYADLAKTHLQEAWSLHPEYPYAAALMVRATMGSGDDERTVSDWFQKSVDAQFDYNMAYNQYFLALLPRWGGSEEQIIAFGQECLASDRFDTCVPYMVLEAIYYLERFEKHPIDKLFTEFPATKLMLDALCRQRAIWLAKNEGKDIAFAANGFPDRPIEIYRANGAIKEAREIALAIPDDFIPRWAPHLYHTSAYDFAKIKATTEERRELIDSLDQRLRLERTAVLSDEAQAQLTADVARLKEISNDPPSQLYLKHVETMLQQRLDFSRGEWVDLLKGPDWHGWEFYGRHVTYDEATRLWTVHGDSDYRHPVGGRPLAGFGFPIEIEMDASVIPVLDVFGGRPRGIAWSPPEGSEKPLKFDKMQVTLQRLFGIKDNSSGEVVAAIPDFCSITDRPHAMDQREHSQNIRLFLWEKTFEFHANQFMFRGEHCYNLDPNWILTFGEPAFDYDRNRDTGNFIFGNIRARRPTIDPIPEQSTPKNLKLAYWQKRYDENNEDLLAGRELAKLFVDSDPERSIELLRHVMELAPNINDIHSALALALLNAGNEEEAAREFTFCKLFDTSDVFYVRYQLEQDLSQFEPTDKMFHSISLFSKSLEMLGEQSLLKMYQARVAFAEKKYQEAVDLIQQAIETDGEPKLPQLQILREQFESALKDSASATSTIDEDVESSK